MKAFWQHELLKEFRGSSDNFRVGLTVYMVFMNITSLFPSPRDTRLLQNKRLWGAKNREMFRRITSFAASVYSDALCYPALQDSESDLSSPFRRGYCAHQYYHRRRQVRDFWTHRIFRRIATNRRFMMGFARLPLPSMVLFGGVGGFLFRPTGQVRKCRPASGFTFRQTLMPEFDQTPFYIARSRRRR